MNKKAFITPLLALPLSRLMWAQTDTLLDGLSNEIRTPEGLRSVVERKDPRFVLVDVRSPDEFAAGHISTAINIPGGITADMKTPPDKDRYVAVYCHGGRKSPAAGGKMLADGCMHVFVWGGILSWPYEREVSSK